MGTDEVGANGVGANEVGAIPSNTDIMNMLLEIKDVQSDILALLNDRD